MEVKKTKTANRRRRKGGEVVVNGKGKKPGRESVGSWLRRERFPIYSYYGRGPHVLDFALLLLMLCFLFSFFFLYLVNQINYCFYFYYFLGSFERQ